MSLAKRPIHWASAFDHLGKATAACNGRKLNEAQAGWTMVREFVNCGDCKAVLRAKPIEPVATITTAEELTLELSATFTPKPKPKPKDPLRSRIGVGIVREERMGKRAWKVSIKRNGIRIRKAFHDSTWGSKKLAKIAAMAWRTEANKRMVGYKGAARDGRKLRNGKDHHGRIMYIKPCGDKPAEWRAVIRIKGSADKLKVKSFGVGRYGEAMACALALNALAELRKEKREWLNERRLKHHPGARSTPSTTQPIEHHCKRSSKNPTESKASPPILNA